MQHHIRLNMIASGKYCVTGAVAIANTTAPIPDAALALRDARASPDDELHAVCGEVSILPMSLGAILKPRKTPYSFAAQ
jgi:hypothetical protein